jgi:hypothetical protein
VAQFQPICRGEIELFDFPYPEKFREMWNLKTGRIFLDDNRRETLYIFNLVEAMNCIYIEEIDFKLAMEMDWDAMVDVTTDDKTNEEGAATQ